MGFNQPFRCVVVVLICICAVLSANGALDEEPQLPDQPKDYAALLRPQLPPGWHCTYDFKTLVISHDEPVTYLNMLGLPAAPGGVDLKRFGIQGPYLITLKFISRLSDADQRALADRRRQAVDEARKGREHEKYTGADVYERHFVPEYFNRRFSVDLRTSDLSPLKLVAPAEVVKQRDDILRLLRANLQKYPAPPQADAPASATAEREGR
jgi:hypothetical protein